MISFLYIYIYIEWQTYVKSKSTAIEKQTKNWIERERQTTTWIEKIGQTSTQPQWTTRQKYLKLCCFDVCKLGSSGANQRESNEKERAIGHREEMAHTAQTRQCRRFRRGTARRSRSPRRQRQTTCAKRSTSIESNLSFVITNHVENISGFLLLIFALFLFYRTKNLGLARWNETNTTLLKVPCLWKALVNAETTLYFIRLAVAALSHAVNARQASLLPIDLANALVKNKKTNVESEN